MNLVANSKGMSAKTKPGLDSVATLVANGLRCCRSSKKKPGIIHVLSSYVLQQAIRIKAQCMYMYIIRCALFNFP